jgi:hypothetical protein
MKKCVKSLSLATSSCSQWPACTGAKNIQCHIFLCLLLPTFIPLSGVVQHVFHHVVIKIQQLFLRPAGCMTSTLLETGAGANDCKYSWDQQLNVPSEARDNKFWSLWPFRTLLSFRDRTSSVLTAAPSNSSYTYSLSCVQVTTVYNLASLRQWSIGYPLIAVEVQSKQQYLHSYNDFLLL